MYRWAEQQEGPCRVSVDWLAGTFVAGQKDPERVIEERLGLGGYAGNIWEEQEGQTYYGWQEVWAGPAGVKLCRNYNRASMQPVGDHVVVPGQACAAFGTVAVIELGRELDHATRVDVCLDDCAKRMRPAVILDRWERGDPAIVTRARTVEYAGTADREGVVGGLTVYLGSKTSERMLRIYDKDVESRGTDYFIDAVRWELQSRGKAAQATLGGLSRALVDGVQELGECIRGLLRGFVDFRVARGVRDNVERWARETWWEEITGTADAVRLNVRHQSTLEGRRRWMRCSMPTLLALRETMGHMWWNKEMVWARDRLRKSPRLRRLASGGVV